MNFVFNKKKPMETCKTTKKICGVYIYIYVQNLHGLDNRILKRENKYMENCERHSE